MFFHMTLCASMVLQLTLNVASQFPLPFPFPGQGGASLHQGAQMLPMPAAQSLVPQMPAMPAPMQLPMHQPRVPLVVMPYYSKNERLVPKRNKKKKKKKRRRILKRPLFEDSSSDSDTSESSSSSDFNFRAKRHKSKKRARQVLTPVVSYITKDGYVVYQKKIRKDKAKDWLELGKGKEPSNLAEESREKMASVELYGDLKRKMRQAKKKRTRDYEQ